MCLQLCYACWCVFCFYVFIPWESRLNLIYSPRGHLLTESTLLTEPRQNGGLTRLLLYIAAVMGVSPEILPLLICARLPRSKPDRLTFTVQSLSTGKLLMHYSCNGSINLLSLLHLLPARTLIPLRVSPEATQPIALTHACPFPTPLRDIFEHLSSTFSTIFGV